MFIYTCGLESRIRNVQLARSSALCKYKILDRMEDTAPAVAIKNFIIGAVSDNSVRGGIAAVRMIPKMER